MGYERVVRGLGQTHGPNQVLLSLRPIWTPKRLQALDLRPTKGIFLIRIFSGNVPQAKPIPHTKPFD
jgi:hypothetical protein